MQISEFDNTYITGRANDDLYEIWAFISSDSGYFADKTIDELVAKIAMLGRNPDVGTRRDDLMIGLRLFPYNSYNIYYVHLEHGVEIMRVLHAARDAFQIFNDAIDMPDPKI